jgi:general stress protein 26
MFITEKDTLYVIIEKVLYQLKRALSEKDHPFRTVILSTISKNHPESRYVVLRGVDEQFTLKVFTDYRSSKVGQIMNNNRAALLFYHPEFKVQVRLNGVIDIHYQDQVAEEAWKMVKGDSRKSYNSILPPGISIGNPEDAHRWEEDMDNSNFAVLIFRTETADVLQLFGHSHYRVLYHIENKSWKGQWIAP